MSDDKLIDKAIESGVISPEQAERMRELATQGGASPAPQLAPRTVPTPPPLPPPPAPRDPDDEKFRLIGGFNDVFVAIGLLLLIGGLFTLARVLGLPDAFAATSTIIAWGLSEVFCRRLRLALPSIMLAIMFTVSTALLVVFNIADARILDRVWVAPMNVGPTIAAIVGGAILVSALLHYWRFRVPIGALLAAVGVLVIFFAGVVAVFSAARAADAFLVVLFVSGLGVFAAAMLFDVSDPERATRRADVGFWLHLLAAPLMVHPVLTWGAGGLQQIGTGWAALTLLMFALIGVVALVIDRRAMLVSGLASAGAAIWYLISLTASTAIAPPLTLLALAAVILALSAFWRPLRRATMRLLPPGRWREALPPV